jgi:hypothetical protein
MSLKRTPLFAAHQQLGGKLIEFGGWEMPVQYTSIVEEHHAVRRSAGVFDISHMGEVWFEGPKALAFLNGLLTNDLRKLTIGLGQYTRASDLLPRLVAAGPAARPRRRRDPRPRIEVSSCATECRSLRTWRMRSRTESCD